MVASSPSLARDGAMPGQCGACGALETAEWGLTLRRDRSRDFSGYLRLCDDCYRGMMEVLKQTPDRGPYPLRGYR